MNLPRRGLLAALLPVPAVAQARPRVVVVGGGFGGAVCARELHRHGIAVTLVERDARYTACPGSNAVIAGLRDMPRQVFTHAALQAEGIGVVRQAAIEVDAAARRVTLADGTVLSFDRLVLAPGVALRFDALEGYDAAAAAVLPHAWQAGPQTALLRRQLEAMEDGGVVVMTIPANPYRCPPGPYERASLIAHHLRTRKPRSKLLVLDAKDAFSKQRLFEAAWAELYPGLLEYVPLSGGGRVTGVEAAARRVITDFGTHEGAVVNVIPPQRAGEIARVAGVADRSGWCPVDPVSFESSLLPGIHVIGDAAIMGAMPKSAFAAAAQARVCASAIAALLGGRAVEAPALLNTCWSLVAPDHGISVAGVYRPVGGVLADVPGAGGTSAPDAPAATRRAEAAQAEEWYDLATAEAFGPA